MSVLQRLLMASTAIVYAPPNDQGAGDPPDDDQIDTTGLENDDPDGDQGEGDDQGEPQDDDPDGDAGEGEDEGDGEDDQGEGSRAAPPQDGERRGNRAVGALRADRRRLAAENAQITRELDEY